jgi:predicted PhzF superfamily epimerase YddE/YHI9
MTILDQTWKPRLEVYQIHAFSEVVHGGNPAGVCLLDTWLDDRSLARIAQDLGPSVTAFVLAAAEGDHPLRWFTRAGQEVSSFCGHATFSAAHVLLRLKQTDQGQLRFLTASGMRHVGQAGNYLSMTVPTWLAEECACPNIIVRSIGGRPAKCFLGPRDYMLVFDSAAEVARLNPDYSIMRALGHSGLIATAQCGESEVVHRFFCPGFSIAENEDHATGSALSTLVPYWTARMGMSKVRATQLSPRGGTFLCTMENDVITVNSQCATFLSGTIDPVKISLGAGDSH